MVGEIMGSVAWLVEDVETLKRLWPIGHTGAEICNAIGRRHSRNGVIGMANRMIKKGLLEPREANNREWRERTKDMPKQPKIYSHYTKPQGFQAPKAQPKPLPATPAIPADFQPLHIEPEAISDKMCRWPSGDGPFTFCGHIPEKRGGYCSVHARIAYSKPYPAKT